MQTFPKFKKSIPEIASYLFILLFVYAAVSKLIDYEKFRLQLGQSPLLTAYAGFVMWIIPCVEISTALLLAIPAYRLAGMYAAFGLMVLFAAYIIAITRFSSYTPCSCGGVLEKLSWNQHLLFNIFFMLMAFTAVLVHEKEKTSIAIDQGHPKTCKTE